MCCGKLNQQKIWKTEPTENLLQSLCTFKCRKDITRECPHLNVLSIETLSCLNVVTERRMKWCGGRKTEPTENFHSYIKISNYWPPCPPPKFVSLVFWASMKMEYQNQQFHKYGGQIFHFRWCSENWRPKLWEGVDNLNFSIWCKIYKMVSIFIFL